MAHQFVKFKACSAEHRRHSEEERELGGCLARQFLRHAAYYRSHRAGYTRNHGYTLKTSDQECAFQCHGSLLGRVAEQAVAEQHEHAAHYEHHGYQHDVVEVRFDEIVES